MLDDLSVAATQSSEEPLAFDVKGGVAGARRVLPLALSVSAYGPVFGMLAQQARLSLLEVLLMSGFVYTGSAHLIVILPRFGEVVKLGIYSIKEGRMSKQLKTYTREFKQEKKLCAQSRAARKEEKGNYDT